MVEVPKDARKVTANKPEDVKILNTNTVATPVQDSLGGMALNLLILGLGDDGVMYKYDGPSKTWSEQA